MATSAPIDGYRDLSDDDITVMNEIKAAERDAAALWNRVLSRPDVDKRWGAVAKTHFQEGFSALVRSVARPEDPFTG